MRPLRVLYLHFFGAFGGASRSLFEAIRAFPPGAVQPAFITQRGTVCAFFSRLGEVIETRGLTQFDNTRYSYYRGVRWLVLLREVAYLPFTMVALARAKRRWREVDLIHLNEAGGLFTLWLARHWFDVPAVVHVRSVLRVAPRSWRTRWGNWMLRNRVQAVVAIDENVRASLPPDLSVQVIHNGFVPKVAAPSDGTLEGKLARLREGSFKVGFVGNLLRVKGVHELVEAARLTRDRGLDVEFIIVGDETRSSRGLKAWLLRALSLQQDARAAMEAALATYSLRDRFHFLGFTQDIARAYPYMNVLAFPSHYDAPGRPVFEAAFFGVPSIVAVRDARPDTLIHNETGLAIAPQSAEQLAQAIARMALDRKATSNMGEAARLMAERNFDARLNAAELLRTYHRVICRGGSPARGGGLPTGC
ncbi:MAG: glycosyltransferase family 4 protein [Proteobacteria bacterium]|nr:glycosyltransferase family 4 protein [Pseudomonadota bacterium]